MALPFSTTTITITRPDETADPYDTQTVTTVGTVKAVISSPSGSAQYVGGTQEVVDMTLSCDPVDLQQGDWVKDNLTGMSYRVLYTQPRYELSLGYVKAGLRRTEGLA